MLPRRKNQQENDPNDQVYRYQVREAEKSPVVIMYNIKQNMLLDKQVNFLERSKKMVVNRITVNQKVMFTNFRRKLTAAKMTHARIKGDIEQQQELREQQLYSGRYGLTIEDEDVLRQIWKSRRQALQDEEDALKNRHSLLDDEDAFKSPYKLDITDSSKTVKFQSPSNSIQALDETDLNPATSHDAAVDVITPQTSARGRLKPTSAVTPRVRPANEQTRRRSRSAVPVIKVVEVDGEQAPIMTQYREQHSGRSAQLHASSNELNLPDIHQSKQTKASALNNAPASPSHPKLQGRAKTAQGSNLRRNERQLRASDVGKLQRGHTSIARLRGREPEAPQQSAQPKLEPRCSIFDEQDTGPSLLDIHKRRLEESDVMKRIHTLINSMSQLQPEPDMIDRDYYTHSVETQAQQGWGRKEKTESIYNRIPENERRRSEGNVNIVSMTVKSLKTPIPNKDKSKLKVRF